MAREVWITGIGLVSRVSAKASTRTGRRSPKPTSRQPVVDLAFTPPFGIHPMVPLDLDRQIPKKSDQRQMEPWQRLGTYAAGLALADAGIAGDTDILSHTHGRRRRRRRARCRPTPHPRRARRGRRPRRLPQRAPVERPPADAVSRPAAQPRRRQHLHRPQGHRLVAHVHGRGDRRRQRRGDRVAAHRRRPGRHLPRRRRLRRRSARIRSSTSRSAARLWAGPPIRCGSASRKAAAPCSVRSARSWSSRRASMPRRAGASPTPASAPSVPTRAGGGRATSAAKLDPPVRRDRGRAPRRSRSSPARPAWPRRPRGARPPRRMDGRGPRVDASGRSANDARRRIQRDVPAAARPGRARPVAPRLLQAVRRRPGSSSPSRRRPSGSRDDQRRHLARRGHGACRGGGLEAGLAGGHGFEPGIAMKDHRGRPVVAVTGIRHGLTPSAGASPTAGRR
jgi:hypothetical protein